MNNNFVMTPNAHHPPAYTRPSISPAARPTPTTTHTHTTCVYTYTRNSDKLKCTNML
jgi:hypothetical protein